LLAKCNMPDDTQVKEEKKMEDGCVICSKLKLMRRESEKTLLDYDYPRWIRTRHD
jgi:hypothetical protein